MTGGRVLKKGVKAEPGSFAEAHGGRFKNMENPGEVYVDGPEAAKDKTYSGPPLSDIEHPMQHANPDHPQGTIGRLVEVVEKLRDIERHNNTMQAQFATGSPSWHLCETIDDRLHDAFVLLGE